MEELLKDLDLQQQGEYDENGAYIIEYDDYDDFTTVYNRLESSYLLVKDSPNSRLDEKESHIEFYNEKYTAILDANFDDDYYQLTMFKEDSE